MQNSTIASPNTKAPTAPILTVSQLTQAIKLNLESMFPLVSLQGEISNFKVQTSGHLYFSLKDAQAQIAVVMFRSDAALLKVVPKAGDQVIVKGEINVYPAKGNYQLVIRELSYVGLGELLHKLELLKLKLHQKGWFKPARKKPIPKFPKRIGVVTSPTGAVIQDIINVLSRRFSGFHLILNPVKVQGEGAAQEIALAIQHFNQHQLVDVMIIGRGGGSIEDLWAFNEEIVAEAIFNSQIPIICAVGHETDHCIADYVADVRAPTPSAAAEIVITEKSQQLQHLQQVKKRMQQTVAHLIQQNRYRLDGLRKQPQFVNPRLLLELLMQRIDDCRSELDEYILQQMSSLKQKLEGRSRQASALKPSNQIQHFQHQLQVSRKALQHNIQNQIQRNRQYLNQKDQKLSLIWDAKHKQRQQRFNKKQLIKRLDQRAEYHLELNQNKLKNLIHTLQAIDPKKLLSKGYSILLAENEPRVINSVYQLEKKQKARLMLSDGEVLITLNEILST